MGIDTSNNTNRPYYVYVAGTGTAETALVNVAGHAWVAQLPGRLS